MQVFPKKSGFTLFEILVVLGILGLSLTLVPPFIGKALDNARLKGSVRELATSLRVARSEAVTTQQTSTLRLDVKSGFFSINNHPASSLTIADTTNIILTTAESEKLSESEGMIRFFPDGSSTGGRILIKNPPQEFSIDVSWLTGKVSISP